METGQHEDDYQEPKPDGKPVLLPVKTGPTALTICHFLRSSRFVSSVQSPREKKAWNHHETICECATMAKPFPTDFSTDIGLEDISAAPCA
jgi:hypothetical protein